MSKTPGSSIDVVRLREAMAAKRMNRARLARALGVSRSTVGRWLDGAHPPSADMQFQLASLLGVPVHVLRGDGSVTLEEPAREVVARRGVTLDEVANEFVSRPLRERQTTQVVLAAKLGIPQQNLSEVLLGKRRYLGVHHLSNYGRALGLTATQLLLQLAAVAHQMELDAVTGEPPPPPVVRARRSRRKSGPPPATHE